MAKGIHIRGLKKLAGKHFSTIQAARVILLAADKDPRVTRIIFNKISNGGRGGIFSLRGEIRTGNLKLTILGYGMEQEIVVCGQDLENVFKNLKNIFEETFHKKRRQ